MSKSRINWVVRVAATTRSEGYAFQFQIIGLGEDFVFLLRLPPLWGELGSASAAGRQPHRGRLRFDP